MQVLVRTEKEFGWHTGEARRVVEEAWGGERRYI
jgi:hypothetical protein